MPTPSGRLKKFETLIVIPSGGYKKALMLTSARIKNFEGFMMIIPCGGLRNLRKFMIIPNGCVN